MGRGWVALLMEPMIRTTCLCVCVQEHVCVHNFENIHTVGKHNTRTLRRSNNPCASDYNRD